MSENKETPETSLNPTYSRGADGLIIGSNYVRNPDGSINWRAMVKPENLYPNKEHFRKKGQSTPSSVDGLPDEALLIKLSGIKELAQLRGFSRTHIHFPKLEVGYVVAVSEIEWIPNFENPFGCRTNGGANATNQNCGAPFNTFLETIAENRAFVRNVRNFLNVNIVGSDEMAKGDIPNKPTVSSVSPQGVLLAKFSDNNSGADSFSDFKEHLRGLWSNEKYRNPEAKDWSDWSDVPVKEARKLLSFV